jgi:hypothetical protein
LAWCARSPYALALAGALLNWSSRCLSLLCHALLQAAADRAGRSQVPTAPLGRAIFTRARCLPCCTQGRAIPSNALHGALSTARGFCHPVQDVSRLTSVPGQLHVRGRASLVLASLDRARRPRPPWVATPSSTAAVSVPSNSRCPGQIARPSWGRELYLAA